MAGKDKIRAEGNHRRGRQLMQYVDCTGHVTQKPISTARERTSAIGTRHLLHLGRFFR
jgi:hypothetical protein